MDPRALLIYTDGSSLNTPRRGGIGVRFVFPDFLEKEELEKDLRLSGYKGATNNQMELKACIVGLEEAFKLEEVRKRKINSIVICTDSAYVVENYQKALFKWQKNKWRLDSGAPVLNANLWKDLIKIIKKVSARIDIKKVKGHSENIDNRAVDRLAKQSAKNPRNFISETNIVRRKITKEKTQVGSIKVAGQKIKIRVVSSRYLKEHRESQIRYEVVSKRNPFFGKVDLIYSSYTLRPGHTYLVKFNCDSGYPKIDAVIKEIKSTQAIKKMELLH